MHSGSPDSVSAKSFASAFSFPFQHWYRWGSATSYVNPTLGYFASFIICLCLLLIMAKWGFLMHCFCRHFPSDIQNLSEYANTLACGKKPRWPGLFLPWITPVLVMEVGGKLYAIRTKRCSFGALRPVLLNNPAARQQCDFAWGTSLDASSGKWG